MVDKRLYIFNPENDMALAQGGKYYVAPLWPRTLAADLSLLPLWYGSSDAVVLSAHPVAFSWQETLRVRLGVESLWRCMPGRQEVATLLPDMHIMGCCPWGWSPSVKTKFLSMGISPALLPDDTQIALLRKLSHRSVTIPIMKQLHQQGVCTGVVVPCVLDDMGAVKRFVEQYRAVVLKAPWSSSGKGICWCRNGFDRTVENWTAGILARQGSVVAERYYVKQADFAMEFLRVGKSISFAGYSCFHTDDRGAYQGNWLAPDWMIERYLSSYVGLEPLLLLQKEMRRILETLLRDTEYQGYLGVDMMIYQDSDSNCFLIHPCVELNLRMSMGMVARILFDRYIASGSQGYYYVDFRSEEGEQQRLHQESLSRMPLQFCTDKIEAGYWSLSPVSDRTRFRAYGEVFQGIEPKPLRFLQTD